MIRFEIEREGMSWGEIMAAGQVVRESRTLSAAWQLTSRDPRAVSGMEGTCNLARRGEGVQAEGWRFRDH